MYSCTNVNHHQTDLYFLLLLTVSCLPQSFDVRMHSFLSHYWIPVLWWLYDIDATIGVTLKMFFPLSV